MHGVLKEATVDVVPEISWDSCFRLGRQVQ